MMRFSAAAIVLSLAVPAMAQQQAKEDKPKAEIIAWDADGKPDRVRVDGYEYKLCKGGQTDSCINPEDAGFDWGGKSIDYWPGRPASEIEGALPAHDPNAPKSEQSKQE